jgi:tetratricopeptide (TPR) repeat protein
VISAKRLDQCSRFTFHVSPPPNCESFVNKFHAPFLTRLAGRLNLPRMKNPCFFALKKLGIALLFLVLSFANLRADGTNAAASDLPPPDSSANEALRAYLQLQEQIHNTQLTIEQNRLQAQAAAIQETLALSNRLQAIEQSMLMQRANDLEEAQRTSHMLMGVLAIFASVGLAAILLMVYFQSRAVSRLADISTALAANRDFAFSSANALELSEHGALASHSVQQSNARLLGLVQTLEKRIAELEHTAAVPLQEAQTVSANNETQEPEPELTSLEKPAGFAKLLEQGQALLTSDRPEEAIACFDEILAVEPNHAEALVKKGTALEKMRQPQEALECYDRAIAADSSLTIAYLHKGGLCSRLEKYGEAMECYERALHTQEKKQAA